MAAGFWHKAIGVLWAALGLIIYPNTLPQSGYGVDGIIASWIVVFLFPGACLICVGARKNRRFKWKQKYLDEQEPYLVQFRLELQKLEHEQELAREERERAEEEEEAEEAARLEAEKEATLAAIRAEAEAVARREAKSRTSPPPPPPSSPPPPPLMPKSISCAGCGARKVLQPMQSMECDYCGTMLVYS
ncbi:hypothetical protein [Paenibacillus sp. FSL H8-0537]|uniref:hypothetical protein n=1 Tax=Paenibacillus sp. FSL H8-0537 TaxID=2921399 RepID=UPI00310117FA